MRATEVTKIDLGEYGNIGNPVSEKSINLQMSEIPHRLALG